jgi:hypothetical protein
MYIDSKITILFFIGLLITWYHPFSKDGKEKNSEKHQTNRQDFKWSYPPNTSYATSKITTNHIAHYYWNYESALPPTVSHSVSSSLFKLNRLPKRDKKMLVQTLDHFLKLKEVSDRMKAEYHPMFKRIFRYYYTHNSSMDGYRIPLITASSSRSSSGEHVDLPSSQSSQFCALISYIPREQQALNKDDVPPPHVFILPVPSSSLRYGSPQLDFVSAFQPPTSMDRGGNIGAPPSSLKNTMQQQMIVVNTAVCFVGSIRTLLRLDVQDSLLDNFYAGYGFGNMWTFAVLSDVGQQNRTQVKQFLKKIKYEHTDIYIYKYQGYVWHLSAFSFHFI